MKDRYKSLMLRSLKDAMDVVEEYNSWSESSFDDDVRVPPQAVLDLGMLLYESRVRGAFADSNIDFPDLDEKMYK
ncbi:MAG: hypothetical protein SV253_10005 [Halobacteria archaeon]|nr:hypothetical protein [Halobacteria archaeon]